MAAPGPTTLNAARKACIAASSVDFENQPGIAVSAARFITHALQNGLAAPARSQEMSDVANAAQVSDDQLDAHELTRDHVDAILGPGLRARAQLEPDPDAFVGAVLADVGPRMILVPKDSRPAVASACEYALATPARPKSPRKVRGAEGESSRAG